MTLEILLQPLSAAAPCGEDMSFSPAFDELQELRRQDDPSLSQGEWVTELKVADWSGLIKGCEALLGTRSKDLRVVSWWTEASGQLRGHVGLADGLRLTRELCERYWVDLHPRFEGQDTELRVGSLERVLARISDLALTLPVLHRGSTALSLREIEAVRSRPAGLDPANSSGGDSHLNGDLLGKALRETPAPSILAALTGCRELQNQLLQLQAVVDGQMGADGPGFAAAKRAVETAQHGLVRLVREAGLIEHGSSADGTVEDGEVADHGATVPAVGGPRLVDDDHPLTTRAQALAQLRQVADFFRRTEPHSPVAYLASKAATWGEMPLHVWLRAVLKDPGIVSQMDELLGVDPPSQA